MNEIFPSAGSNEGRASRKRAAEACSGRSGEHVLQGVDVSAVARDHRARIPAAEFSTLSDESKERLRQLRESARRRASGRRGGSGGPGRNRGGRGRNRGRDHGGGYFGRGGFGGRGRGYGGRGRHGRGVHFADRNIGQLTAGAHQGGPVQIERAMVLYTGPNQGQGGGQAGAGGAPGVPPPPPPPPPPQGGGTGAGAGGGTSSRSYFGRGRFRPY